MEYGFVGAALCALNAELFFALCAGAVFTGFIVCLFVSIFKSGYGQKKRCWYVIVLLAFCALLKSRANLSGEVDLSPILACGGLVLGLPLFFIRVKISKNSKKREQEDNARREFVRFLDERIHNPYAEPDLPADNNNRNQAARSETFKTEILKAEQKRKELAEDLDFSHVKNVLERLEPATLSYADRKQVHELELALYEAEKGEYSDDVKCRINEGLGNLLKIMAKHGV